LFYRKNISEELEMTKRLLALVSVLTVASLALAACGAPPTAAPEATEVMTEAPGAEAPAAMEGTIKVATQSPLSGGQSALGTAIKQGAELGLEQLGGPLRDMGFTVELAPYDDQANPETGVANAKNIVADPEILCLVGHLNSGVMIPSSEEYHTAGLGAISPANTNVAVTDRGYLEVNRIVGRDDVQGATAAQFAFDQGWTTAYVLHDKTAYGQGLAEFFKQKFESLGGTVAGFEGTEEKANFDPIITPLMATTPDVVFFGGIYDQIGVFIKQVREKGYLGAIEGGDGFDSSVMAEIAGDSLLAGDGSYYVAVSGPAKEYPDTAKFIEDYKVKFSADPEPYAVQAFDAMGLCLTAIENAAVAAGGVPARADVAAAIRALVDYEGITGTINFNAKGDIVPTARYFIIQVVSAAPDFWSTNAIKAVLDIEPE
jgi:branched-chain amino acid transport system substrate-binding protein